MTQQAHEEEKKRMITLLRKEYGDDVWLGSTKCGVCNAYTQYTDIETVVDYLLSNGTIMPPCKVGDMVYSIGWLDGKVHEEKVSYCSYNSEEDLFWFVTDATSSFSSQDIGVCEFFSREAAEQALKERD